MIAERIVHGENRAANSLNYAMLSALCLLALADLPPLTGGA